ncbi:MAG: DUF5610 domain-containing protein [Thermodesulfobacteriota bacterium]|nr:DUF5610 domain-containing protein [Thermodesulfobacteriota bacterium]
MTLNISRIPTYTPQTFFPPNPNTEVCSSGQDKMHGSKIIPDSVDLSSIRGDNSLLAPACYGRSCYYQEDAGALLANINIDYEGEDGSKFSINLSYKTMYRVVRYEVSQASQQAESLPEDNPHPLDDYFGPKATSERIVDFAKTLLDMFGAQENEDMEKLTAFFDKLINAIDEGFREAKRILGILPNNIADMIDETYSRVMKGVDQLRDRLFDSGGVATRFAGYYEEVSYEAAPMEISIEA